MKYIINTLLALCVITSCASTGQKNEIVRENVEFKNWLRDTLKVLKSDNLTSVNIFFPTDSSQLILEENIEVESYNEVLQNEKIDEIYLLLDEYGEINKNNELLKVRIKKSTEYYPSMLEGASYDYLVEFDSVMFEYDSVKNYYDLIRGRIDSKQEISKFSNIEVNTKYLWENDSLILETTTIDR